MGHKEGLLLVSLDGGGARAFSQLVVMKELMHQLKAEKYPNNHDKIMLPCQEFDMIGGSDTGGLLALMFTRLRMSVDEAMAEFTLIVDSVYKPQFAYPSQRTQALRDNLEWMFERKGIPLDIRLQNDPYKDRCKGFCLVLSSVELRHKVCLRSYNSPRGLPFHITLLDAMLATCASSPSFSPVGCTVGFEDHTYIGADLGANNPSGELISEAYAFYGSDSKVACLLNLGAGHPGTISMPSPHDKLRANSVHQEILTDSEIMAQDLQTRLKDVGIYFRLSVGQGMRRNGQSQDIGWITAQSRNYLQSAEASKIITKIIQTLSDGNGWISLDKLRHTGAPKPVYRAAPLRAQHYVHRKAPWGDLERALLRDYNEQSIIIIAGMTGCGKTQLVTEALRVYNSAQNDRFDHTFFVDGSSEASIKSDLIAHVQPITGKDGSRVSFEDTLYFFQNPKNRRWLIVYDNVDDTGLDLRPLLPKCGHGTIIVTTTNQLLQPLASEECYIGLEVMSEDESVELILRCAGSQNPSNEERHAATLIAHKLGCLPVALTQAGCFIANSSCSCAQYFEILLNHLPELMNEPSGDRQNRSAYATFDITYGRLPPEIRNFVHFLSFFHFANFPLAAISQAVLHSFSINPFPFMEHSKEFEPAIQLLREIFLSNGEWTQLASLNMIRVLRNYSLASFTSTPSTQLIRVHPLMREWAFDRISPDRRTLYQEAASRFLICCTNAKHLHQYLPPHISAITSRPVFNGTHTMNNLAAFGKILRVAGQLEVAQGIWKPIVATLQQEHGPDHLHVATAQLELASTYDRDQLAEMERLERDVIRIRTALLGTTHLDTLMAMNDLSGTFSRRERYKEAQDLSQNVLENLERQLPASHPSVVEARGWLASLYATNNQLAEAEAIQIQILEEQKSRLGHSHPDTLEAMRSLASTYHEQERHAEAEQLQLKVLNDKKRQLGETNLETLIAMEWLALTYHKQGRHTEAEALRTKVLEERKAQLGMWHSDTFGAMDWLVLTYVEQGRYVDAEPLRLQLLEACKLRLGEDHPDTLLAMNNLAVVYPFLDRHKEAEALQVRLLEKRIALDGEDSMEVATCTHNLAWTYYDLDRLEDAEALATKAEKICRSRLGVGDPEYEKTARLVQAINERLYTLKPMHLKFFFTISRWIGYT